MKKVISLVMFIISVCTLAISLIIFYNIGIASDELGTSPQIIYGSSLNNTLSWIRLLLLLITVIFFGTQLIIKFKH